jgi:hypothetical protein
MRLEDSVIALLKKQVDQLNYENTVLTAKLILAQKEEKKDGSELHGTDEENQTNKPTKKGTNTTK